MQSWQGLRMFSLRGVCVSVCVAGGGDFGRNPLSLPLRTPDTQAISEFTQQDDRKKRMAKRLCVTNVKGLLLMCFVLLLKCLFKGG